MDGLVLAFRQARRPEGACETATGLPDLADLADLLASLYARGRAAHPRLDVTPEAFGRCLARSMGEGDHHALPKLSIEDLYLACACAAGVPGAATRFEAQQGGTMARAIARVLADRADREETAQKVRQMLLTGSAPKIAQYLGQGPLAHWISVVAIRLAVSTGRSESTERRLRHKAVADVVGVESPELRLLNVQMRAAIETAIAEALARLGDRDRLVLRLYLISGMSATAMARAFDVSHSTVGRWLKSIRDQVLADVRRTLGERLDLARGELASIVRAVASQLNFSISRLLRNE